MSSSIGQLLYHCNAKRSCKATLIGNYVSGPLPACIIEQHYGIHGNCPHQISKLNFGLQQVCYLITWHDLLLLVKKSTRNGIVELMHILIEQSADYKYCNRAVTSQLFSFSLLLMVA